MATLSLHAKQAQGGTIAYDMGHIEMYEYPRGKRRLLLILKTGIKKSLKQKDERALMYEVLDYGSSSSW